MRSIVTLPAGARDDLVVYLNGVEQREGSDYELYDGTLIFDRVLRKDRVSGWRWLLGAWGVGTYRQDDTVDIAYELDGEPRLAHDVAITLAGDESE